MKTLLSLLENKSYTYKGHKFIEKDMGNGQKIYEADWDYMLSLDPVSQGDYTRYSAELNKRDQKPAVDKRRESVYDVTFSDFKAKMSKKLNDVVLYKMYIEQFVKNTDPKTGLYGKVSPKAKASYADILNKYERHK